MRINWRTDLYAPRCRVIDLDTGRHLAFCAMADDETGEVEQYVTEKKPSATAMCRFSVGPDCRVRTITTKRRVRIEPLGTTESYLCDDPEYAMISG